ncbi:MAG TPA: wax ester/triacylglycerol synthase family O-acyltransferase [Acetobacteraceae bacterium]|nr:wax ester/triacylglycerol synthase family O-acyltransferase [Acetobacteraceae bacterium]
MGRLKALDASFLYVETAETPMHVAGLTLFDLPDSYRGRFHQVYRDFLASRLDLAEIFRRKLAATALALDHPSWVEDKAFDLDHHVRGIMLPGPGSFAQLEQTVARLHGELLDRTRPLWQFTIIEGLADGRAALYSKVHHAALDGGAGMVLTQAMYDVSPQPRSPQAPPRTPLPAEPPAAFAGLGTLYVDFLRRQVDALQKFPDLLRAVNNVVLPKIPEGAKLTDLLPRAEMPRLPPLIAPRTKLNVQISGERSYAARSLPLAVTRRLAKSAGAKLNDIVMAVCAGALRTYLQRANALPRRPLVAFVPISLRELGNKDMSNQVSGMLCSLATNIEDPAARLKEIMASSRSSKELAGHFKDATPTDFSFLGAPVVLSGLARLYGRSGISNWINPPANVVISNVPGPPVPLFCAEAKVSALYPVSIPAHGMALNMTVQSYVDNLDFGLTADRRALPDIDDLADLLEVSFKELAAALAPPAEETVVPMHGKKRVTA